MGDTLRKDSGHEKAFKKRYLTLSHQGGIALWTPVFLYTNSGCLPVTTQTYPTTNQRFVMVQASLQDKDHSDRSFFQERNQEFAHLHRSFGEGMAARERKAHDTG